METKAQDVSLVPPEGEKMSPDKTALLQVEDFKDELRPQSADSRRIGRQKVLAISERGLDKIDHDGRAFGPSARSSAAMARVQAYYLARIEPLIQNFVTMCLYYKPENVAEFGLGHFGKAAADEGKAGEGKAGEARPGSSTLKDFEAGAYAELYVDPVVKPLVEQLVQDQPDDPKPVIMAFLQAHVSKALSDAEAVFAYFDADASGQVDRKELQECLKTLGFKSKKKYVKRLIKLMDEDGDGQIDVQEFCRNCPQVLRDAIADSFGADGELVLMKDRTASIVKLTQELDYRKKGYLSQRDLRQLLFTCGIGEDKALVRDVLAAMTVDKYGDVLIQDFCNSLPNKARQAVEAALAAKGGVATVLGEIQGDPRTAAMRLQSLHRGRADRAEVKRRIKEKKSATAVQGLVRQKQAKKKVAHKRSQKQTSSAK